MRFILALICFTTVVSAAIVHGTVFDSSLEPLNKAIVEVDSTPEQRVVSLNGEYSFELLPGEYLIIASYSFENESYSSSEEIVVESEGNYSLDLIVYSFSLPELDSSFEEELLADDFLSEDYPSIVPTTNNYWFVVLFLALVVAILLLFYFLRNPRKKVKQKTVKKTAKRGTVPKKGFQLSVSQRKIINALKKNEGFLTQKQLRVELRDLSEARVSMDLTELEEHEFVKKFRRGRGNKIKLLP